MKARLYKGPFNGRVAESHGRNSIVLSGPKRMTKKQKYRWFSDTKGIYGTVPKVSARYQMIIHNGIPLRHPDGSVWYEYQEGSKCEW